MKVSWIYDVGSPGGTSVAMALDNLKHWGKAKAIKAYREHTIKCRLMLCPGQLPCGLHERTLVHK